MTGRNEFSRVVRKMTKREDKQTKTTHDQTAELYQNKKLRGELETFRLEGR